jgi:alkylhydroperoxidase/carboxymuconolactone decarboxylase family protein YurZ
MAASDSDRLRLKDEFIANRGYWTPLWDAVLEIAPEYFAAHMKLSSVPWKTGTLEPKVREFIYIAIDTSTTHLHKQGTRVHMQNAIRYGATQEELMEVLQLTSVLGVHTMTMGLPALVEVMRKLGRSSEIEGQKLTPRQEKMKADWIATRGFWADWRNTCYVFRRTSSRPTSNSRRSRGSTAPSSQRCGNSSTWRSMLQQRICTRQAPAFTWRMRCATAQPHQRSSRCWPWSVSLACIPLPWGCR